jgi:hypothetical protein
VGTDEGASQIKTIGIPWSILDADRWSTLHVR